MANFSGSVDSYGGRFGGGFDLEDSDGAKLELDQEVMVVTVARVKEVALRDTPTGDTRLVFVMRPDEVRLVTEHTTQHLLLQRLDFPEPDMLAKQLMFMSGPVPTAALEAVPQVELNEADLPREDVVLSPAVFRDEDPTPEESVFSPERGRPVSNVSPNGNVSGTSQIERDPLLARFIEDG